ncbi:MAG TPA: hypothetical protein VF433_00760, partial [Cellvibrio sp.]
PNRFIDPMGLLSLTMAVSWTEVVDLENSNGGGLTTAWVNTIRCECAEVAPCTWKLVGCKAVLYLDVQVLMTDDKEESDSYWRWENEHVSDFREALEEIRKAGKEAEDLVKEQEFGSKLECLQQAVNVVVGAIRSARDVVGDRTRQRDIREDHTYDRMWRWMRKRLGQP